MLTESTRVEFDRALSKLEPLWEAGYDDGVLRRLDPCAKTLKSCMSETVAARKGEPHIAYRDSIWTYAQTDEAACCLANALIGRGRHKGDRVVIMLDNTPELVIAYCACYKAGFVAVGMNPRSTLREIWETVLDCEASALVVSSDCVGKASALIEGGKATIEDIVVVERGICGRCIGISEAAEALSAVAFSWSTAMEAVAEEPEVALEPDDVAMLIYTGGTTGVSKGCPLTHRSLIQAQRLFCGALRPLLGDERSMTSLVTSPMTHAYGMNFGVNWGVVIGGTVVLADDLSAEVLGGLIEKHRPEVWGAVPALVSKVDADFAGGRDLSSLKVVVVSCAATSPEIMRRFRRLHPEVRVIEDYGMTETSGPVTLTPVLAGASEGSVGFPASDTDVLVVDMETGLRPQSTGMRGEVIFRGPQMMSGYWKRPDETARTMRDEWVYSGDVGYFDERGCLFIIDRIKDVISVGGFSVFPREIDEVLYMHPEVVEVCTIGVADKRSGERPKSFVVARAGSSLTERSAIDYCRERLIAYKCPKYIEFVAEIPKNRFGKPDKRMLRRREKKALG